MDVEAYGDIGIFLGLAGIFISVIPFVLCVAYKKTRKYAGIFVCTAGFCFFTALRHLIILLGYDDITDPNYEAYKDWNVHRFILSDVIRLFIWLGIGILYYFTFIKGNRLLKGLLILGAGVFLILLLLLMVLSAVTVS